MDLFLKAGLGAAMVVLIAFFSRTPNYYIAGLVPLFPTFSLIAHYIVGAERSPVELKATILFGIGSMAPYLVYLVALYWLLDRLSLPMALSVATLCWLVGAAILILLWSRIHV